MSSDLPPRAFRGLSAVYGNEFYRYDSTRGDWGEVRATVLEPGCFARSIAEINARPEPRTGRIPLFWSHSVLIGCTLEIDDTPIGVPVMCKVTDDPTFDPYLAHIQGGAADGMSIGFEIFRLETRAEDAEEVDHIFEADAMEVTACVWGANPEALISEAAARRSTSVGEDRGRGALLEQQIAAITQEQQRLRADLRVARGQIGTLTALIGR